MVQNKKKFFPIKLKEANEKLDIYLKEMYIQENNLQKSIPFWYKVKIFFKSYL
jgi:hypothetical protein